jgi:AbrB family looped-hinge helix DNA binding protein
MKTKITDKFQITIPKEIRKKMNLSQKDSIEWTIEEGKIIIKPLKRKFLKYKGYIKVGEGNIEEDIQTAKNLIAKKSR